MATNALSVKDIKRAWHHIDAKDQVLGRLATKVATILLGKNKAQYVPYLDNGDYVVVTNASSVKLTGKKPSQKVYFRHSGYPGGDRTETFNQLIVRRPNEVIRHAVKGMLPKTKLGREMIKKLYIFEGNEHNLEKQLGETANAN